MLKILYTIIQNLVIQDLCTPALGKETFVWKKGEFHKMRHNVDVSLHWPEGIPAPYLQSYGTSASSVAFLHILVCCPAFLYTNYDSRSAFLTQVLSISKHHFTIFTHGSVKLELCPHSLYWMTAYHHIHQRAMFHIQHTLFWQFCSTSHCWKASEDSADMHVHTRAVRFYLHTSEYWVYGNGNCRWQRMFVAIYFPSYHGMGVFITPTFL
jgi:hypothetical protein